MHSLLLSCFSSVGVRIAKPSALDALLPRTEFTAKQRQLCCLLLDARLPAVLVMIVVGTKHSTAFKQRLGQQRVVVLYFPSESQKPGKVWRNVTMAPGGCWCSAQGFCSRHPGTTGLQPRLEAGRDQTCISVKHRRDDLTRFRQQSRDFPLAA